MTNQAKAYKTEGSPGLSDTHVLVCLAGPVEALVEEGVSAYLGSRGLPTSHIHSKHCVWNPPSQSWGFKFYVYNLHSVAP